MGVGRQYGEGLPSPAKRGSSAHHPRYGLEFLTRNSWYVAQSQNEIPGLAIISGKATGYDNNIAVGCIGHCLLKAVVNFVYRRHPAALTLHGLPQLLLEISPQLLQVVGLESDNRAFP